MNRILPGLLALALSAGLGGCTSKLPPSAPSPSPSGTAAPSSAPPQAQGEVKTGLAVLTGAGSSADAGDEPGVAQTDSNVVAVTVDGDGRILRCVIDAVQAKINFDASGNLLTDPGTQFLTKQELGDSYGMSKASSIGKDWYAQADSLAAYVVGKTVEEVKGISLDSNGAPADEELRSSVTFSAAGCLDAVIKAAENAQGLGAGGDDRLGLGILTTMASSAGAQSGEGLAQTDSTFAAATFDTQGRITSCILDGVQAKVNFSPQGRITTDLGAEIKTKDELGEAYGMKKASSIGKEWNEEAGAYARYATGRTVDELMGLMVNEKGAPEDEELRSSVTISVGGFNAVLKKAYDKAG